MLRGQQAGQDSVQQTTGPRDFKRLDIFPAISYAPETKLTLGAIGFLYFDRFLSRVCEYAAH